MKTLADCLISWAMVQPDPCIFLDVFPFLQAFHFGNAGFRSGEMELRIDGSGLVRLRHCEECERLCTLCDCWTGALGRYEIFVYHLGRWHVNVVHPDWRDYMWQRPSVALSTFVTHPVTRLLHLLCMEDEGRAAGLWPLLRWMGWGMQLHMVQDDHDMIRFDSWVHCGPHGGYFCFNEDGSPIPIPYISQSWWEYGLRVALQHEGPSHYAVAAGEVWLEPDVPTDLYSGLPGLIGSDSSFESSNSE